VVPVLRHCLRARRLWVFRDAATTTVLIIALYVAAPAVAMVVGLAQLLAIPALVSWWRKRRPTHGVWQVTAVVFALHTVLSCLLFMVVFAVLAAGQLPSSPSMATAEAEPYLRQQLAGALIIAVIVVAIVVGARMIMLQTMTTTLAADSTDRGPEPQSRLLQHRLATVDDAQRGNILLHSGYHPFLGAGPIFSAWSLAMELKRDRDGLFEDGTPTRRDPVAVDPVELNRHVKRRLAALRSDELPEAERLTGLRLRDLVVATGSRWQGYPLIDQRLQVPYSMAGPAAMEAIIRHPQAGARHFLRASVGADSSAVTGGLGETIMPAEHQNVVLSAFTHIAIEGGMLYVENVTTLLGPLRQPFLDIDRLTHAGIGSAAVLSGLRTAPLDLLAAPIRLIGAGWRALVVQHRANRADRDHDRDPVYDFGSRTDLRELASATAPTTYLQRLDAEKYAKLLQRRINEAIVDYLRDHRVDTSEFETRISHIHNEGVMINKAYGPVAQGTGARATTNEKGEA
jgi:hypothetical protein